VKMAATLAEATAKRRSRHIMVPVPPQSDAFSDVNGPHPPTEAKISVMLVELRARGEALRSEIATVERRLVQISSSIDESGPVLAGSRGQPRVNGLLSVERTLQRDLSRAHKELLAVLDVIQTHEMAIAANELMSWSR
jgi:hypothetical protein